ncbi:hypothetical protein tb265_21980 [Gemmatimonadetes bacterium T265]|nr:hypothetical protein tb265_21980 [Gemmatimonadetes bacterium T265]
MPVWSRRPLAERRRSVRTGLARLVAWTCRALAVLSLLTGAHPLLAQGDARAARAADTTSGARPTRAGRTRLTGEWLQASAGPIGRHALPSLAATLARSRDRGRLAGTELELGWLRAARPTTTAEGVSAGIARPLSVGRVTMRPGFAVLVGRAISTVDSGGYDWRGIAPPYLGQTGYQDRPRLTSGATVGAGLQLGADVALWRGVHATGSMRRWTFTGDVIRANRSPFLAGFGLAFDRARRATGQPNAREIPRVAAAPQDTTR